MKRNTTNLRYLFGEDAYLLYWQQVYKCRPRLRSIMSIDLNLEIITDSNFNILAYRHDIPEDIKWMVMNAGLWQVWNEKHLHYSKMLELKSFMSLLNHKVCWN